MDYTIRKIKLDDLDSVFSIGNAQPEFSNGAHIFWTKEQLNRWFKSETDALLVASKENKIVGFLLSMAHIPTGKAVIENLYVLEEERGKGIGETLLKEGLKIFKQLGVTHVVFYNNSSFPEKFASYTERLGFRRGPSVIWMDMSL